SCSALPCLFGRLSRRAFNKSIKLDDFSTQKGPLQNFRFATAPERSGVKSSPIGLFAFFA
ncbi:MAG: hypothetical protein LKJ45_00005, partial [Oscillospiraceae bacterium]|nr:hypothetical protein [Oscillospiraceae bacterium]